MEAIDSNVSARLLQLVDELPMLRKKELLKLIESWGVSVEATRLTRSPYFDKVSLMSVTGEHHGRAKNLSASGVFVETYASFKVGDKLSLTLILITSPDPIKLLGEVKRIAYDGVGICFHYRNRSEEAMLKVALEQRQTMLDMIDGASHA